MPKKKNKKQLKKKNIKKAKTRGKAIKSKKICGKRIKIKVIVEPKKENVYGATLSQKEEPGVIALNEELDLNIESLDSKLNFYDKPEDLEELHAADLSFDDLENEEQIVSENNIQPEPVQEEYQELVPFQDLSLRQKNIIMYISLTCVMVIIVGFWFVGLRASLGQSLKTINLNSEEFNGVKNSFKNLNQEATNIKNQLNNQVNVLPQIKDEIKQTMIEEQLKNEVTEKMKEKLENQNINTNQNLNSNVNSTNSISP